MGERPRTEGLAVLVCAAGSARRMRGLDKLMQPVGGVPVIRHLAQQALAAGGRVIVALPPRGDPWHAGREAALAGLAVELLEVAEAGEGMAAAIRAGVAVAEGGAAGAAAERTAGLMVMLADMPEITTGDLTRMRGVFADDPDRVVRAVGPGGAPGHPVIFPRRLFGALARIGGDNGARSVLRDEAVRPCPLPGARAVTDLDTPEDWAAWRERTGL